MIRNELEEIKYRLLKLLHKINIYNNPEIAEEITELIALIDELLQVEVY